jgi:hypothetical protein
MVHHVNYVQLIATNAKINHFALNVHNNILLINKINVNFALFIIALRVKIILIVLFVIKDIISKIHPLILCVLNVQQVVIFVMILAVIDALLDFI